ncbi:flavin reductase domain protein FMN-binding protein [Pseudonocardia dioxanivorans CB1190]|jgi:flavin reductase (DIM6/NTAB) family NADH-FMN oxidoreductase RutF|uniref:Flavin reductase domain protein FMN-binding protein n=1 Tax=Pseudonocardia dioxanivorans (strain ATCC 55486 / DSM 44775 / JCM 13855 / CB1190) TaxID=675635 RepID=F4CR54_PSEUX|nr:flavin reductase family protein [Pseudonocardia dioxanivorans]AEA24491.1 flavin reductase domain protein FMN-binding protein [Pseudonocardia dioxanivorans CB1190]
MTLPATTVDPRPSAPHFRQAISHFSTGVAVVTTRTSTGPAGMTASAVASLSLDPVQLLVCIGTTLPTRSAIEESGRFAVNVLGEGQEHLARRFATRRDDKFAGVALRTDDDVPVLADAIAHFVCSVGSALPGGDHTIVIGDVLTCEFRAGTSPLVYFASTFGGLCDPQGHAREAFHWQLASAM